MQHGCNMHALHAAAMCENENSRQSERESEAYINWTYELLDNAALLVAKMNTYLNAKEQQPMRSATRSNHITQPLLCSHRSVRSSQNRDYTLVTGL